MKKRGAGAAMWLWFQVHISGGQVTLPAAAAILPQDFCHKSLNVL
jgi:hypothetical protein